METPIDAFWLQIKNLNRLLAEDDLRQFDNLLAAKAADSKIIKEYRNGLIEEMGVIAKETHPSEELDRGGLNDLRTMI